MPVEPHPESTRAAGRSGDGREKRLLLGQANPAWAADEKRTGDAGRGDSRDPFSLADRTALVTGAARGIGLAVSERLAVLGAHVILTDINVEGLEKARSAIEDEGGSAEALRLDVTDRDDVARAVAGVIEKHGRLDILINNAGICINATALDTSSEVWERQMRLNLDAVFFLSQAFGAHMVKAGRGAIVNLSSFAAVVDVRPQKHVAYSVSKAGVAHLSRVLASEWAQSGVRVNAIAPGFVMTDMPLGAGMEMHDIWRTHVPTGRFLHPYEIANVIAFLASDASSAITGQLIMADGGITIW
jgi:NAD(P)-dependent dehydrogenase (short-subunit alcohol dehydrogenase family)